MSGASAERIAHMAGRSGGVSRRAVQERAGSRMDAPLLNLIDYSCLVQAVSLYEHQSGGRRVFDRKV